jgi:hypothetical protein
MEKTKNQLAIKGHPTRGKEVIEILEMLGANNKENYNGGDSDALYILNDSDNNIDLGYGYDNRVVFKLEEFLKKYPFRIGDTVVIKSADCSGIVTWMRWSCVTSVCSENCEIRYGITPITSKNKRELYWRSSNEIEFSNTSRKDDRNVNNICDDILINMFSDKVASISLKSDICDDEVELNLGDYEIEIRGDKTFAVKKKPKYPKTYEECCGILGITFDYPDIRMVSTDEYNLYSNFIQLIRCRDAYWKIAGEQMWLGEPWKPDWTDNYQKKWLITFYQDEINFTTGTNVQFILAFPTEEMRDSFFENFKDLIEKCKKLL